jgi:hypothetical protein
MIEGHISDLRQVSKVICCIAFWGVDSRNVDALHNVDCAAI